ncbi:unnamed protein product [Closterium sp. NIES-53]
MASLRVLTFDHEGHPIQFDTWLDDLQLYLLSDSRDSISLFDHTSRASLAPPATADSTTRSQWLTRDAAPRLAIRNHVPLAECAHFGQHKTPNALYDAVVDRYSSPSTAALGHLLLPYLFPKLSAFATAEDLVTHLRTSDARYRSALQASGGGSGGFGGGGGGCGGCSGSGGSGSGGSGAELFRGEAKRPRWAELLQSGVAIFDIDYDAILAAMYALSVSAEGNYYLCVLPDPSIEAGALGASESALPGTAPAKALHTFTLDSGSSRCFFRDSTTLTPLSAPVPVRLADPLGGLVLACSSTVLPCPAVPTGSLPGLHLSSFSTNLVSASGLVATPCSCRLLLRQTLLWHHRLGHPSLPRLRGMHSRLLVSGFPRSLPPLPPSPALPCLPCVEGRQRAAPHSSSFPPTNAPLQDLHMDVWGPACINGQGRGRYFLLVVQDYMRYTTVFPLRSKGDVPNVLIPWIRANCLQLHERFCQDLPFLRLHYDRGGEFSFDLLRDFCRGEGILLSFTLLVSAQQNGIAGRCIGLVMKVARTSMIHAAAPHFLWPFAVRYAAHQLNLWPRVSLPETSPTLRWTGKVGDASVFWFYHPTSRCVFPSQDVTCDESVPFYHPLPPQGPSPSGVSRVDPLPGTVRVEVTVDSGAAYGGAASRGAEPASAEPEGAESEGAGSGGAAPGGAERGGAEPVAAKLGGAEPEGAEPGGAVSMSAESGGAEPRGTASSGGPAGASP